jgi:hypothetical protein
MTRLCLADINGPFFDPNRPFRNWSSFPFYQIDLEAPPYVDLPALEWGLQRAIDYLHTLHRQGYNGIVIDNLAHLVGFEDAGPPIYEPASPFRRRAYSYRQAFSRLFAAAADMQMSVFVAADMQWSTPPLRRYAGRLRADNPRLAQANRRALRELFQHFPQLGGLLIRVGETGGAHDQGQNYQGHLIYDRPAALRSLIATLLPICAAADRLLIVRSWSIGIGELGDLICSPERYRETFGDMDSPHLLVAIKHGPADFFRRLPPNPTLGLPGPRQVIELQNRREYELFGMVPSAISELHRAVITQAGACNDRFAGIWAWNSTGGWGGGTAVLGTRGWSCWTELNSALTAALFHDPSLDTSAFVQAWFAARLPEPFAAAVATFFNESAELFEHGWYFDRLVRGQRELGTLYLAPLLWIWWLRPTSSLLIWAYLASAIEGIDQDLAVAAAATTCAGQHAAHLARCAPSNHPVAATIVTSAAYLHDMLACALVLRRLLLPAFAAVWHHDIAGWYRALGQLPAVRAQLEQHQANWGQRHDFPALELGEIMSLLHSLERHPILTRQQARLACMVVQHLHKQGRGRSNIRTAGALAGSLLLLALLSRRRAGAGILGLLLPLLLALPLRRQLIKYLLPRLSRKLHLLPSVLFETGPAFTEWAP